MRKLLSTLRIAATLVLARTLGRYEVSVSDGRMTYARYRWRGETWGFPTQPIRLEQDDE